MHLGQRKMQQFGPTLNLPALLDFLEQQSMPVASSKVRRAIKCPSFSDTVAIAHFYLQLRLRAAQFNARIDARDQFVGCNRALGAVPHGIFD